MNLSLSDYAQLVGLAQQIDPNPVRLGGRLVGLDQAEQQAIPAWGWYGLAAAGALTAGILVRRYFLRRRAERM